MIKGHPVECRPEGELTPDEERLERLRIQFHAGRILFQRAIAAKPQDAIIEELAVPVDMLPSLARKAEALVKLREKTREGWPREGVEGHEAAEHTDAAGPLPSPELRRSA